MAIRSGREFIASLRDCRMVYANGGRIADVTEYLPFRGATASLAKLYDLQHEHPAELTFASPSSGSRVAASFLIAQTVAELEFRRRAEQIRADSTYGLMGRMPDFCNAMLTDLASGASDLGARERRFGDNILRYHEFCRENDLCLTHTLIDPQVDRARGPAEQSDPFLTMRPVRETGSGVIVRGAKMLATLAPLSNELLVGPFLPRKPGEEDYALCFALPCNTPGLKFICRETYDDGRSDFDRPLTSHYDEQDALVIFEDVLVPWERMFIYRDIEIYNSIMTRRLGCTQLQACIRGLAKLKFLAGLACHIAEAIGRSDALHVRAQLGELVANVELVSGLVRAGVPEVIEAKAELSPPRALSATLWVLIPQSQVRAIQLIRELSGSGLILTPTGKDFDNPEIAAHLEKYLRAKNLSARDRVQLFKLAWDMTGEPFGSRQLQYEWFYAGDPYFTRARFYGLPVVQEYKDIVTRLLWSRA
jgi:anthranilate 3-monooxygenase (FAD)/4-hydroxyphenylacetate 3-monooxygenase